MQEWYAQDLVEQYRELYPDLTADEADTVYKFARGEISNLWFRCRFETSPDGFMIGHG